VLCSLGALASLLSAVHYDDDTNSSGTFDATAGVLAAKGKKRTA
jgi:hypothetical protein